MTQAAHPTASTAVDVMVCSPYAQDAGEDCTESGKREKRKKHAAYLQELEHGGVKYAPAVISSFGRRHPDVTDMLTVAAKRAARHRGHTEPKALMRAWTRNIAVACWTRAARMVHRCLQGARGPEEEEEETPTGEVEEDDEGAWTMGPD